MVWAYIVPVGSIPTNNYLIKHILLKPEEKDISKNLL
jgi:hypothetical protein